TVAHAKGRVKPGRQRASNIDVGSSSTSRASLLPMRGASPSGKSRTSNTPTLVVLMVTATRAAWRAPVPESAGCAEVEDGAVVSPGAGVASASAGSARAGTGVAALDV